MSFLTHSRLHNIFFKWCVSTNPGHTNVSARQWKNKKKVKLKIMVCYLLEKNVSIHSHGMLNNKVNRNRRKSSLKSKFFSSTLCGTVLSIDYLGRNLDIEEKTPTTSCMSPQNIEHKEQSYNSPSLLLKNHFFFQRLAPTHPIKIYGVVKSYFWNYIKKYATLLSTSDRRKGIFQTLTPPRDSATLVRGEKNNWAKRDW